MTCSDVMATSLACSRLSTATSNTFLLHDLLADDGVPVDPFIPSDGLNRPGVPQDVDQYIAFRNRSAQFVHARKHPNQIDRSLIKA